MIVIISGVIAVISAVLGLLAFLAMAALILFLIIWVFNILLFAAGGYLIWQGWLALQQGEPWGWAYSAGGVLCFLVFYKITRAMVSNPSSESENATTRKRSKISYPVAEVVYALVVVVLWVLLLVGAVTHIWPEWLSLQQGDP